MMLAATMLVAASCSEFDDYNKEVADASVSGNQTLWDNIQQNDQLSDFAALIKKSGFDKELSATQYYTVWAPLNGTFDPTPFQSMNDAALMRQFVKNHIASYAHNASGKLDATNRVLMLNEKTYGFTGSGSYQFDGVDVAQANLPNSNGVLHTLNGVAVYYPNLYEYVTDSVLCASKGLDSLSRYFSRYEQTTLDLEHSVVGSIVNGMQTYIDSVMITENTLWDGLNFKMMNEDSTYTFLMPTNEAWNSTYSALKGSFRYIPNTISKTFNDNTSATSTTIQPALQIDNVYWQDSIANRYMTRYLAYSNNNAYNKWLVGAPTAIGSDTLATTLRDKMSNPAELLAHTVETVKMSNGYGRIIDSLAIRPWETYSPEFDFSATSDRNIGQYLNGYTETVEVRLPDTGMVDLSEQTSAIYRYLHVVPSSTRSKPELVFYLRNVLSTTYDIYCIFVPEAVDTEKEDPDTLPNRVIFTLNYCDSTGALKDEVFLDTDEARIQAFKDKYKLSDGAVGSTNYNTNRAFSNDVSKVDTLYVGEFTFPICYLGLGDNYCPSLRVSSPFSTNTGTVRNNYARDLRIAGVILKPKELVEYEEQNKQ